MDEDALRRMAEDVKRRIAEQGYFVQHVFSDPDRGVPSYSYTSGLSYARERKYPEFAMAGRFRPEMMQGLLVDAVEAMRKGDLALGGPRYYDRLIRDLEVGIAPIRVDGDGAFLWVSADADTYLIVLPDPAGLYPWDEGCDPNYAVQTDGFEIVALPERRAPPAPGKRH